MTGSRHSLHTGSGALAGLSAAAMAVVALTIAVAGCQPGREEVPLGPRLPIASDHPGGSWEEIPVLNCDTNVSALAAWSEDDVLVGGERGTIVRFKRGALSNVDLPDHSDIVALATAPGQIAYATTWGGTVYRFANGSWTQDRRTDYGAVATDLWCDPTGTVTLIGRRGRVLRRAGDEWTAVDLGTEADLLDVWGRGASELWIVGTDGFVAHFDGAGWRVEHPESPGSAALQLDRVCGDAEGRVAILHLAQEGEQSATVFLREGGAWERIAVDRWTTAVALIDGRLLALTDNRANWWNDGTWVPGERLGFVIDDSDPHPVHVGDCLLVWTGRILMYPRGTPGLLRFRGTAQAMTLVPRLGNVYGLATEPDGLIVLTANGMVLRRTPAGWAIEAELGADHGLLAGFLRGSDGRLMAASTSEIYQRSPGGVWQTLELPFGIGRWFGFGDGEVCLVSSSDLWAWNGSSASHLCGLPSGLGQLRAAVGQSPREGWFLFDEALARFDGVTMAPVFQQAGAGFRGLAVDPGDGLLLYGEAGLYAWDGAVTRDMTPRLFDPTGDMFRPSIRELAVTADGDLVALVSSGFCVRRVAGEWQDITLDHAGIYGGAAGPSILASDASDVLVASDGVLLHYTGPHAGAQRRAVP